MKTNKQTVVVGVSHVAARQTPAGFAMTITGRAVDDQQCVVDVTFDWSWFTHLARSLGGVLTTRDESTRAMRAAAADALG